MQVVIFHSIKGGVGRTLALANSAMALARADKRVLMLDCDYSAPGLHAKFGMTAAPGYIDYLREATLDERCAGVDGGHGHKLRRKIREVRGEPNLCILTAGDDSREEYWGFLSSFKFHRLFYFTKGEIAGLNPVVFPLENLAKNRLAFEGDLDLMREASGADYLLVDCKTSALDAAMFAVKLWADRVVHLFPDNPEGTSGARRFMKSRAAEGKAVIPVVSRVPEGFTNTDAQALVGKAVSDLPPVSILHECRGLEAAERLLLDGTSPRDLSLLLSHDYVDLCKRLAPEIESGLQNTGNGDWKKLLRMAQDVEILEQYFDLWHSGPMLNRDGQPNIALRVETFRYLMDSIYADILGAFPAGDDSAARNAFRKAGHGAGVSFGKEMMETEKVFPPGRRPPDLQARLDAWAEFDSDVGFGRISARLITAAPPAGSIVVENNFLAVGRKPDDPDINQFFCGYLQGVLERLLECPAVEVAVAENGEQFTFAQKT